MYRNSVICLFSLDDAGQRLSPEAKRLSSLKVKLPQNQSNSFQFQLKGCLMVFYIVVQNLIKHSVNSEDTDQMQRLIFVCTFCRNARHKRVHADVYHSINEFFELLECSYLLLTLLEARSIHDFMNRPKIEFIAYIYILL